MPVQTVFNAPITISVTPNGTVMIDAQGHSVSNPPGTQPPPNNPHPQPPPLVNPPPATKGKDALILQRVRELRGEGPRGSVLASMLLEFVGAGSRLEPILSKEIHNYTRWLDWRSFSGQAGIDDPSDEWTRMKILIKEIRSTP
jgi:hypothetical protein